MSAFFDAKRNLEEFEAIHGFRPSDVAWEPRRTRGPINLDPCAVSERYFAYRRGGVSAGLAADFACAIPGYVP